MFDHVGGGPGDIDRGSCQTVFVPATILQLSDTHLVADRLGLVNERSPDERLSSVIDGCVGRGDRIDVVVLSGDLSEDGSPESYARVSEIVAPLGVPVFALAGNHDDASNVVAQFGDVTSVTVGGWAIVGLDTTQPGKVNGSVDLREALSRIDRCGDVSIAVVMHHPPISLSTHPIFQFDGAAQFMAALAERPQVRVVLSGHLHGAFDLGVERLRLLGCPSTLYGIAHHGAAYTITRDDGIGARSITLGDDGTLTTTLL